jgi:hypothetical protein
LNMDEGGKREQNLGNLEIILIKENKDERV